MVLSDGLMKLPDYRSFSHSMAALNLPISCSELHGILCGYLAAGGHREGESYLRALLAHREAGEARQATMALFDVFTISQHQLSALGFEFELMLPDDDEPLARRAQAFSEWCEGFTQGITVTGLDLDALKTEEAQDAVHHLTEFAQLDYDGLQVNEDDERALMEVIEYARMAVLSIHADVQPHSEDDRRRH
ncbi:MAG: YecA family protein [Legionella sp.]|nr:MAG: YecA family protein [Legionella sp.]